MSIRRRKKIGQSLLIAGAGVSLNMACFEKVGNSGNLMPPPMVELCIEVEPETAAVTVNTISVPDGDCLEVYEGDTAIIEATAEGYQDHSEELSVTQDTTHSIEMIPEENTTVEDTGE